MSHAPFCETLRETHFDICTSLAISTANYFEEDVSEHSGFELCYTVGNSHYYRHVRNRSWHLIPGQLMVLNGLEKHREECTKTPTISGIRSLIIEPRFIGNLLRETGIDPNELVFDDLIIPLKPNLQTLLDAIFAFKETSGASHIAYDCLLTELLIVLIHSIKNTHTKKLELLRKTGHFPNCSLRAKQAIHDHIFSTDVDLEMIARASGLSKYHFIRDFKKNTGISPIQYMNQLRVDFVKQQLLHTSRSITEISTAMGYRDISTFNKSFKKYVGVSPSTFIQHK